MTIHRIDFSTGVAVGVDASATSTGYTHPIFGEVLKVYVNFQDSPPAATCDFTLSDEGDPASEAIVSIVNSATDAAFCPRRVTELNDGTDITYDETSEVYEPYVVAGRLEATIAQVNAADYADVTVWYRS